MTTKEKIPYRGLLSLCKRCLISAQNLPRVGLRPPHTCMLIALLSHQPVEVSF